MKHRKGILHRQMIVERLADMATELYARTVTIARTQRLVDERGAEACERELSLCDLFCVTSGHRFRDARTLLQEGGEAIDERRRAIAASIRADGGYAVADALLDVPLPPRPMPTLEPPAASRTESALAITSSPSAAAAR